MQARGLQQPLEGIKAIASLAGGGIVLWIVYVFGDQLLPEARASAPGGSGGVVANDWLTTGEEVVLPAIFIGLVLFGLIATAIQARRT